MKLVAFVRSLAHPSYTGTARDPAWVVGNIVVTSLLAVAAEALVPASGSVLIALGVGLLVVRGYAVPGTPRVLTVLSGRVARWGSTESLPRDEHQLLRAGVIEVRNGDLRPTAGFVTDWRRRVVAAGPREADGASLAAAVGLDPTSVSLRWQGELLVATAKPSGRPLGVWLSRAALVADIASMAELRRRYPQWDALSPRFRGAVLATLRLYLDVCPVCDGALTLDRAPSRVSATDAVVALTCTACDGRLFESGFASGVGAVGDDTSSSLVGQ